MFQAWISVIINTPKKTGSGLMGYLKGESAFEVMGEEI